MSQPLWSLDADDPRAPSQEVWERIAPGEQQHVVSSLPTDMPLEGMLGELVEARDNALKHAEDEARRADALAKELVRVQEELDRLRKS